MSLGAGGAGLAAFRHRDYRFFLGGRMASTLALQMQGVAVGWQVYAITHSPFALGLVGLVQFIPILLLALVAGHAADRYDRRLIVILYNVALAICALLLLAITRLAPLATTGAWPIFAVLVLLGSVRAFAGPAGQAYLPSIVPRADFPNAVTWNTIVWQVGSVVGPAVGGVLYGWVSGSADVSTTGNEGVSITASGAGVVYGTCAGLALIGVLTALNLKTRTGRQSTDAATIRTLLAGLTYVREQPLLLGAITLDLFAVLLGGAVALLPAYAQDILKVGPSGLGLMRAAPASGAALMATLLAFRPIGRRAGQTLLLCVAIFGLATIVFALSSHVLLTIAALVIMGAADLISVVVRSTLVQLNTPPDMRGRVSAVNGVAISASNELGEFESGLTAAWLGLVPATVIGGIGTLIVVGLWAWRFPALRRADRLI